MNFFAKQQVMTTENSTVATTKKVMTKDEIVKGLLRNLEAKKLALENAKNPNWKTSGKFSYSSNPADTFDIRTVTNEKKLVEVLAFLIDREEKIGLANTRLGINSNFLWLMYSVAEWEEDLKTRKSQLDEAKLKKELIDDENKINSLVSKELRDQMLIELLAEKYGDGLNIS